MTLTIHKELYQVQGQPLVKSQTEFSQYYDLYLSVHSDYPITLDTNSYVFTMDVDIPKNIDKVSSNT